MSAKLDVPLYPEIQVTTLRDGVAGSVPDQVIELARAAKRPSNHFLVEATQGTLVTWFVKIQKLMRN